MKRKKQYPSGTHCVRPESLEKRVEGGEAFETVSACGHITKIIALDPRQVTCLSCLAWLKRNVQYHNYLYGRFKPAPDSPAVVKVREQLALVAKAFEANK